MATVDSRPLLQQRLRPVEQQWRDLVWVQGVGLLLFAVGLPLGMTLAVDLFCNLPATVRLLGLWLTIASGAWIGWRRLVRPLWIGIQARDVANWLEAAQPRLQERLLTCLEFDEQPLPASKAARLMQRQVHRETWALLEDDSPEEILPAERSYRRLGLGLVLAACLVAPFSIWLSGYGLAWQRVCAPLGNWGWGRNFRLEAAESPRVVARGKDATIRAVLTPRRGGLVLPEELTLAWRSQGSPHWDERRLSRDVEAGAFVASLPRLSADTEFVVRGPSSESPRYLIRVVDPPRLQELTVAVDPPAYTGQPSLQGPVGRELEVCAGSRLRWSARFDRPVAEILLDWPSPPASKTSGAVSEVVTWTVDSNEPAGSTTTTARTSGEFVVRWRSPEGFEVDEPPRRLIVIPDQPPVVRIEGQSLLTLRPDERHAVSMIANDDYGLTVAELQIELSPTDRRVLALPFLPRQSGVQSWNRTLDLLELGVQPGQAVSLRARVVDNCEVPGHQERWSDPQLLVISQSAPAAETRAMIAQADTARDPLRELMRDLTAHREELRAVHQKTAAATVRQKDPQQEAQLQALEQKQQDLNARFEAWEAQLPQGGPWDTVARMAESLRETQLSEAARELAKAQTAEPRDRIEQLSRALDDLASAQKELQRLDDEIRAIGNLKDELGELARLANQSDRLAERLQQAANSPPQPASDGNMLPSQPAGAAELNAAAEMARQLLQDFEELLASEPELQGAIDEFQRQQAAALARQLSEIAAQQQEVAAALQPGAGPQTSEPADAATPANRTPQEQAEFQNGAALADQLQQLQQQATALAEAVQLANPQPAGTPASLATESAQATADSVTSAAQLAQRGALTEAGEQLAAASEQNQQTQSSLPMPASVPGDRSLATEAAALGSQLERLQAELAAAAQPAARQGAMAQSQQQLAEATQALNEQIASQTAAAPAGAPVAGNVSDELSQAARAMQATRAALQGNDEATAAQQAAAAANQLQQAQQQLAAQASTGNRGSSRLPTEAGASLSSAASRLSQADQQLQQAATPNAPPAENGTPTPQSLSELAQQYQQAAASLREAAQAANGRMQQTAQQSPQNNAANSSNSDGGEEPNATPSQAAAASLEGAGVELRSGIGRTWGRLEGTLKTDMLDGGPLGTHPEYRDQVRRYFETIAGGSTARSKPSPAVPPAAGSP